MSIIIYTALGRQNRPKMISTPNYTSKTRGFEPAAIFLTNLRRGENVSAYQSSINRSLKMRKVVKSRIGKHRQRGRQTSNQLLGKQSAWQKVLRISLGNPTKSSTNFPRNRPPGTNGANCFVFIISREKKIQKHSPHDKKKTHGD